MAELTTGNLFKLFYSNDPANSLPVGAGVNEITNLSSLPTLQINSQQVTYETYESEYDTVLLNNKSISPFDITVNYVPDEASTVILDQHAKDRDLFQIILKYRETEGTVTYGIVSGYITGTSTTGDKDSVVRKSYTFTPLDEVVSLRTIDSLEPLYEGSYGVGSNGVDVPQYQPVTPEGNAFIKVPSSQAGNPAGADMMGIGWVDGTSVAEFAVTKSGTLSLYAKNASTAWTRILTATQIGSQYVPITRTVNGKPLSGNITLDSTDTGSLAIANNLSDVESVETSRTNLGVYSKTEVDTKVTATNTDLSTFKTTVANTYVPKTLTVNGKALSGNIVLAKGDVGLGNVTNDAQLKIASNLSDLNNVATARTNLGVLSSTEVSNTYVPKTLTVNGKALSGNIVLAKGDVGLGNVTNDAQLKIASNLSDLNNVAVARTNLGVDRLVNQGNDNTYIYAGNTKKRLTLNSGGWWGVYDEDTSSWQQLPMYAGGTGGGDKTTAAASLGTFYLNGQSVQPSSPSMNDFTGTLGSAGEIYNVAASNSHSIANWPVNVNGNNAYGWGALMTFKHHLSNGGSTQFYIADNESGEMYFRMRYSSSWRNWARFWTSRNTTIDANGFVKSASPIVKLYNDQCILNDEAEGVTMDRTSEGVYNVYGTEGLNKEGWTIEIPQDINGNRLCFVETDFDETTKVLSIKTFTRKFDINTAMIVAGEPMDIPTDRWVDLRVEMPEDSIWNKNNQDSQNNYK